MKQTTAYGVRIHAASMKPVQDMVRIYRQAVTFLIKVCNEQWNSISDIPFLVRKQSFVEGLIHHTKTEPGFSMISSMSCSISCHRICAELRYPRPLVRWRLTA